MKLPRLLDASLAESRRLHPVSLQISESLIPLSTATMTVRKNEAIEGRSFVKLYTPNGRMEVYRTRVPEITHGGDTAIIQLEHAICEVGDYMIQDAIKAEKTVREAFVTVFNHYRGNLWQLGTFSSNTAVILDCDYDNVLETLLAVLEQASDHYMTFDFTTSPWTVNVATKSHTVTAEGRLSRNIASAVVRRDDKDLCTRVYVKGLPKPSGRESDENAIGYMDAETISEYGIVEKETGGTNLTQTQAQRVATAYLEAHQYPKLSVEIEAVDLSEITGESFDAFVPGKLFRLAVPDENVVIEDYITKVSWSDIVGSPYTANIVIGDEQDATINFLQAQASASKSAGKSAKKQAKTDDAFVKQFEKTDEYGAILEQAGMQLDSHGLIVYARDNINNIGAIIDMTASALRSEYADGMSGLQSTIEQTASSIRLEVASTKSDVHSLIVQTPELIHTEVGSAVSGFAQSVIDQTATYIRTEVHGAASAIAESVIEQTTEYIQTTVEATASEVAWSVITQTMTNIEQKIGSKSRIFVGMNPPSGTIYEGDIWIKSTAVTTWGGLALGKWQDRSTFRWKDYAGCEQYVYQDGEWVLVVDSSIITDQETKIDQDKTQISLLAKKIDSQGTDYQSRLSVTAERIRGDVSTAKSQLYSVVEQTATRVFSGVYDRVSDNFSTIEQTAQSISMGVGAAKSALYAEIMVTATGVYSAVHDYVHDNFSTILQTSTSISLAVGAAKSTLYSQIMVTATGIVTSVTDYVNDNFSTITQTSTSIALAVGSAKSTLYSQIMATATGVYTAVHDYVAGNYSTITQTSTNIAIAVASSKTDWMSAIDVQKGRINLVVSGSGSSASIKADAIGDAINGSSITISASRINLNGYVKATDFTGDSIATKLADVSSLNVNTILAGAIRVVTGQTQSDVATQNYVSGCPYDMRITSSGNNYTLQWKRLGYQATWQDIGTFSRATTLTGAWSSGTVTVSASPQGNTWESAVFAEKNGNATKDTTWENRVNVPYKISAYNNGSEYPVATGKTGTLNVDISALMQDKDLSGASSGTYYPDSGYVGFESVTISGGSTPSASNVDLNSFEFSTGKPSYIDTYTQLSTLSSYISTYSHGYVYFRATINGGTGEKWYRVTLP